MCASALPFQLDVRPLAQCYAFSTPSLAGYYRYVVFKVVPSFIICVREAIFLLSFQW